MKEGLEMLSKLEKFEATVNYAKNSEHKYIGVKIKMFGFEKPEVIINRTENFDLKLAYYKKAYTDDLVLKTYEGIRIVGLTFGDSFAEIEKELGED